MKPEKHVRRPLRHTSADSDSDNIHEHPPDSRTLRPSSTNPATVAARLKSHANAAHWEPKLPFDLVVAYENEAARARAFTLCDHLVGELQDDHDIRQSWWKFPFLYEPHLLERATDAALGADMIIISLNNGKEPPFIARTWIEGWLKQKDGHGAALVALVDNTPSTRCSDCPMLRYLNGLAHKSGMDFFPQVFATAPPCSDRLPTNTPALGPGLMPVLEDILHRPNNDHQWGINEY